MKKAAPVAPGSWKLACRQALQWRLLLLWTGLLLIPTLIFGLSTGFLFSTALDHSVHAARIAASADMAVLGELANIIRGEKKETVSLVLALSLLCTIMLSPLLSGISVTAMRAAQAAGFGDLVRGACSEYGRMLRLLLLGLVPLGIAAAAIRGLMKFSSEHAEKAISWDDTRLLSWTCIVLGVLVLALMHAILDSARADFALDTSRRSAFKALWRGLKTVARRPLLSLGFYLSITLIALLLALPLIWLRINVPHASVAGFVFGFLLVQVLTAVLAWMRNARLFALAAIVRAQQGTTAA
jgi:hypothetical protein